MAEEKLKRPLFWSDLKRILNLSTHFPVTKIFRLFSSCFTSVWHRSEHQQSPLPPTHTHTSTHTHTHQHAHTPQPSTAVGVVPYLCLSCWPAALPTASSTRVTAWPGTDSSAFCTLLAPPLWIRFTMLSRDYSR